MSKSYLLPCPQCEHKLEVEGRQAGRSLNCPQCDSSVEVPTFRVLKSLATDDTSDSSHDRTSGGGQSTLKGILFTVGLGLAVIAGVGGWALYNYASDMVSRTNFEADVVSDTVNAPVDDATVVELWDVWEGTINGGDLPDWEEANWTRYNKQGNILLTGAYVVFGISGIGFLVMMSSFLVTNPKS